MRKRNLWAAIGEFRRTEGANLQALAARLLLGEAPTAGSASGTPEHAPLALVEVLAASPAMSPQALGAWDPSTRRGVFGDGSTRNRYLFGRLASSSSSASPPGRAGALVVSMRSGLMTAVQGIQPGNAGGAPSSPQSAADGALSGTAFGNNKDSAAAESAQRLSPAAAVSLAQLGRLLGGLRVRRTKPAPPSGVSVGQTAPSGLATERRGAAEGGDGSMSLRAGGAADAHQKAGRTLPNKKKSFNVPTDTTALWGKSHDGSLRTDHRATTHGGGRYGHRDRQHSLKPKAPDDQPAGQERLLVCTDADKALERTMLRLSYGGAGLLAVEGRDQTTEEQFLNYYIVSVVCTIFFMCALVRQPPTFASQFMSCLHIGRKQL